MYQSYFVKWLLSTWLEHIKIRGWGSNRRPNLRSSRTCEWDSRCWLGIAWTFCSEGSRRPSFTPLRLVSNSARLLGILFVVCWRCSWWICGCVGEKRFSPFIFPSIFPSKGRFWGWREYRWESRLNSTVWATWSATRGLTCGHRFTLSTTRLAGWVPQLIWTRSSSYARWPSSWCSWPWKLWWLAVCLSCDRRRRSLHSLCGP